MHEPAAGPFVNPKPTAGDNPMATPSLISLCIKAFQLQASALSWYSVVLWRILKQAEVLDLRMRAAATMLVAAPSVASQRCCTASTSGQSHAGPSVPLGDLCPRSLRRTRGELFSSNASTSAGWLRVATHGASLQGTTVSKLISSAAPWNAGDCVFLHKLCPCLHLVGPSVRTRTPLEQLLAFMQCLSWEQCRAGSVFVCRAAAADTGTGLELTAENVELVLDEIRPYLMAGAVANTRLRCRVLHCCGV